MSTLPMPPDHQARMRAVRARAQWELGDPDWADRILDWYFDDTDAVYRRLAEDKAAYDR